jgi:hypothetical protein
MAGGVSAYLKAKMADQAFGGAAFTPAATLYLAAFTVTGDHTGRANEVSATGTAYAPVAVANNLTTGFAAFTANVKNLLAQTFPACTGTAWGTVSSFGLFDAASGGNEYAWADLLTPQAINPGATLTVNTNDVNWTWT